ncbi:lytic transglycosylase domain-containing protein [Hugenholtzia roseola]|uniref:lytic transglycosylase domain-containing protein n=1 Tax=Hugenholtzia roseola TaxID=1002 RepID=UPI0004198930|nr:lytic transglycosylase domain-containing protein [Hugenholtzia roseola]
MKQYLHLPTLLTGTCLIILGTLAAWFLLERYEKLQKQNAQNLDYQGVTIPANYHIALPDSFSFCGEEVPLENPEVAESFEKELYINVFRHSSTNLVLKRAQRFFPLIEKILREEGLPEDLKYIAVIESDLENVRSPAGAEGYWQFMPATAKEFSLEISKEVDERFHLEKATRAAAQYFKRAHKRFGNWTNAAASYNNGMGGMRFSLRKQALFSYYDVHLNQETARYIYRALAMKEIMENPDKYGFQVEKNSKHYLPVAYQVVKIDSTIQDLVTFARYFNMSYKTLKYHNPWLISSKLTNKDNKVYEIKIPTNPPALHSDKILSKLRQQNGNHFQFDTLQDSLKSEQEEVFFEKE